MVTLWNERMGVIFEYVLRIVQVVLQFDSNRSNVIGFRVHVLPIFFSVFKLIYFDQTEVEVDLVVLFLLSSLIFLIFQWIQFKNALKNLFIFIFLLRRSFFFRFMGIFVCAFYFFSLVSFRTAVSQQFYHLVGISASFVCASLHTVSTVILIIMWNPYV